MKYLSWNEKTITDFSDKAVSEMYENGYVFTRIDRGVMQQTRSLRIDLNHFEQSSENRRIQKKVPGLHVLPTELPLSDYNYAIGKIAKDFYETKFGAGVMSAQKIKEMLTDMKRSNFNMLLKYTLDEKSDAPAGFTICFATKTKPSHPNQIEPKGPSSPLLHYSYPFYDLQTAPKDMGLAMMITAIQHAKDAGFKYIYLGSLQRSTDVYKLQFKGLEWFDGTKWSNDLEEAKKILISAKLAK